MLRTVVLQLSPEATPLPLAGARGFALSGYGSGASFPVPVTLRSADGQQTELLAREGAWNAISSPVVAATAQLPASAAAALYQLDAGGSNEDGIVPAPATPAGGVLGDEERIFTSSPTGFADMAGAGSFEVVYKRPAGAKRFVLWCHGSQFANGGGQTPIYLAVYYETPSVPRMLVKWAISVPYGYNIVAGVQSRAPGVAVAIGAGAGAAGVAMAGLYDPNAPPTGIVLRVYASVAGATFQAVLDGTPAKDPLRFVSRWDGA